MFRTAPIVTPPNHSKLPAGLLNPLPIPQRPWSHIAIDFITDLPNSQGYITILTIVDRFSKACRLIPLTKLPTAFETAELLCNQVFRFYGLPEDIVSDRGPQLTSRVWTAFFKHLNVNISLTSGYHPQSNGQTERLNQDVIRFLRSYCKQHQADWSRYLFWAEYAQNSLVKPATGITPFKCILGFQPPLFPWSGEPTELPSVTEWLHKSEEVWDQAHSLTPCCQTTRATSQPPPPSSSRVSHRPMSMAFHQRSTTPTSMSQTLCMLVRSKLLNNYLLYHFD